MISFKFMLPQINPKSEVTFWPGVIGICALFHSAQISIRYISWFSMIVGSQSHSWSFPMHTLVVTEKMDRICPCCWTVGRGPRHALAPRLGSSVVLPCARLLAHFQGWHWAICTNGWLLCLPLGQISASTLGGFSSLQFKAPLFVPLQGVWLCYH